MKSLAATAVAAAVFVCAASAHATTFVFKGDGGFDSPTGNIAFDCGSTGLDPCSDNDALGLAYSKDGIGFTAFGYTSADATHAVRSSAQLIQDVFPGNSGIAVLSEADPTQDQTQFGALETIDFLFNQIVTLTNIEFNAGNDVDCSAFGSEGPCGDFDFYVDSLFVATIAAADLLAGGGPVWTGTRFSFRPKTPGGGFNIAQFTVNGSPIPVPAALPLLLSGLAGLSLAARRKRAA